MRTFALGEMLATRTVRYQPRAGDAVDAAITIGMPTRDDDGRAWICPFQIAGIRGEPVRAMFGEDAMQALVLALHILPTRLQAIAREEEGSFPNKDEDLGLTQACRVHLGDGVAPKN